METSTLQNEKERLLWKQAKKRVGFRNHLISYLLINVFLWVMWAATGREVDEYGFPWPMFCTLGWGFGLAWHFMSAFAFGNKNSRIDKEFQKLKDKTDSNTK